ncbi:hypothetical protein [Sphingomonas sp. 10B4]|uniref:hypothetical protein n=1 Tax=Sphingomonas sp. 10B4 TaxID=3048575 RepID=UPI002AB388A9|nr:hypothetical protein [Sphingomonas sp. 10B4]MDY7525351.1 hypothetical protein [Sphingomonas sp. 10B4]MEB0284010.1 hypothetical protein [Sphingomonas sp. 10B4]
MMRGEAQEPIPFGAQVLCRCGKVSLAKPEIANGTACARPRYAGEKPIYRKGECVSVEPIEGLGARDLHAMANAPLMDANRVFLPAGKLTMAEYRARVAADLSPASNQGSAE